MVTDKEKGYEVKIETEQEQPKERQITIDQQSSTLTKVSSIWSWHQEFAAQWSETFVTKTDKKNPKR